MPSGLATTSCDPETMYPPLVTTGLLPEFPPLQLPVRTPTGRRSGMLKPRQLARWAAQLPRANLSVCVEQVCERLRALNAQDYPLSRRERLLAVLAPLADELIKDLAGQLGTVCLPMPTRGRASLTALSALLAALTEAYKLLAQQWSEQLLRRGGGARPEEAAGLAACVQRIMDLLGQRLLVAYRCYAPPPPGLWRELHLLYRYAEDRDWQRFPVVPMHGERRVDDIHAGYMRQLLLALAEPAGLMPDEIVALDLWLAEVVGECTLSAQWEMGGAGDFMIDLGLDRPPRYQSAEIPWQGIDVRVIELAALRRRVEQQLQPLLRRGLEQQGSRSLLLRHKRDLLLHLAETWRGGRVRKTPRRPRPGLVRLAVGLSPACTCLRDTRRPTPTMDELKLCSTREDMAAADFASRYRAALEADKHLAAATAPMWSDWRRTNLSATGLGLHHAAEGCPAVRPGELLIFRVQEGRGEDARLAKRRVEDGTAGWCIGVIRWLRSDEEQADEEQAWAGGGVNMGVWELGRDGIAVHTRGLGGPAAGTGYTGGLLLALHEGSRTVPTLLTAETRYDVGSEILINDGRELRRVRLTRLRLITRHFARFDFQTIPSGTLPA